MCERSNEWSRTLESYLVNAIVCGECYMFCVRELCKHTHREKLSYSLSVVYLFILGKFDPGNIVSHTALVLN